MDIALPIVALAVTALALVLVRDARNRSTELARELDTLKRALDGLARDQDQLRQQDMAHARRDLDRLQGQVEHASGEIAELKAAAQAIAPPPPLPKARSGGLDDLRQRLRAAHAEDEPSDDASTA